MLSEEQLRHLADLAKIELSAKELEKLGADINSILAYVEQVKQVDLTGVEPMIGGGLERCPLRQDTPQPCDSAIIDQIIVNFPEKEGRWLKVPKVIEK